MQYTNARWRTYFHEGSWRLPEFLNIGATFWSPDPRRPSNTLSDLWDRMLLQLDLAAEAKGASAKILGLLSNRFEPNCGSRSQPRVGSGQASCLENRNNTGVVSKIRWDRRKLRQDLPKRMTDVYRRFVLDLMECYIGTLRVVREVSLVSTKERVAI